MVDDILGRRGFLGVLDCCEELGSFEFFVLVAINDGFDEFIESFVSEELRHALVLVLHFH